MLTCEGEINQMALPCLRYERQFRQYLDLFPPPKTLLSVFFLISFYLGALALEFCGFSFSRKDLKAIYILVFTICSIRKLHPF